MKLQNLLFLLIFGLAACYRVSSEVAPERNLLASEESGSNENLQLQTNAVVPILEMNSGGLLGGSKNGKWLRPKEVVANLKADESYKLFGLENSKLTEISGAIPTNGAPCEDFYSVNVNQGEEANGVAFGSQISWNPIPRALKKFDANSAVYRKAVTEVLASKGLAKSAPKITQIFQADLDGDGADEVVLSATVFKKGLSSRADVGDYSFVLLRKVAGGKAENSILAGDFVKSTANAQAPAEYKISAIADLNGDGKMEIVVYANYYEGDWVQVFELKNGKSSEVGELKIACGA